MHIGMDLDRKKLVLLAKACLQLNINTWIFSFYASSHSHLLPFQQRRQGIV
jgi:hypothetical protein